MRALFITNYYPPTALGGYEMWCQEVAQRLTERGHQVTVATSRGEQPVTEIEDGVDVRRALELEVVGGVASTVRRARGRKRLEAGNAEALDRIVAELEPDIALMWGMWNLPRATAKAVERRLQGRTAYYFCDYWTTLPSAYLQQLSAPARTALGRIGKGLAAWPALKALASDEAVSLDLLHPMCTSYAVKAKLIQDGVAIPHAEVIHGGICTKRFHPAESKARAEGRLRLVYVGRITADKGVHTAIEAMRLAAAEGADATLDIYGRGDADFVEGLKASITRAGLSKQVSLRGSVTASSMPALLRSYDALVFPSEWDEPFARTVLEAMASGIAVIGTTTGGTGEILKAGQTGLTFQAGDASSLAAGIRRLAGEPGLAARLGSAARGVVANGFDLSRMVDQLEEKLAALAEDGAAPPRQSEERAALSVAHT